MSRDLGVERFYREARAVAALTHTNIVTIHSVKEADGVHFLTMELVEGRSLDCRRASRSESCANDDGSTFRATSRFSRVSRAR